MRGDDDIQDYFYSNWVDNGSSDHNRYHEGSSNNGIRIDSCLDQTTDNNYSLHLRPQGDSPIGLSLRKSKSLLNLVEMTLSKEKEKQSQPTPSPTPEKLKASNFPAHILQIGSWKRISRNEGDLVAKLYYAKKKLVWEFLDGPLKSKIEIQWSEISAIRVFIYEGQNGRLEIELSQPPQFGREINPQPRKHTQWKQTTDFTGGQASVYRRHSVIFSPGVLDKQYEKLLQCDNRLFDLSKQPFPINNYPFFYHDPNHYIDYSYTNAHHHHDPYTHAGGLDSNSLTSVAPFQYFNIERSTTRHTNKNRERGNNQFEVIPATSTGIEDQFIPYHGKEPWTQVQQTTSLHEESYSIGNEEASYEYGNSWVGIKEVYGLPWEQGMYKNQDYI